MALDAEKRIPDTTLPANSFKDGDILYGSDMNRVVDTLKTAVNENYKDLKGAVKGGDSIYINPIEGVVDAEGQPIDTVDGLIKWLYDNKVLNEGKIYSLRINDSKQFEYYDGENWKIATVGQQGEPGEGVPTGGLSGQFLRKQSDVSYDTEWVDAYDKPQVDSKINNLTKRISTNTNDINRLNKFSIITLGTTWTQDITNGYYTQTVVLSGITSNDNPIIDVVLSDTLENMQAQQEDWSKILKVETSTDALIFYASEVTTTALDLIVKIGVGTKSDADDIQTELIDIRVGYNGTTYDSAGDAVREQVTTLNTKINDATSSLSEKADKVEVSELKSDLADFKDGFGNYNLFGTCELYEENYYVNITGGHITHSYDEEFNIYIMPVDGASKYTFGSSIKPFLVRFLLPLSSDKYTATSNSLLANVTQIDISQYPNTEYIAFSFNKVKYPIDSFIVCKGEEIIEGFQLPKWHTDDVNPIKQNVEDLRLTVNAIDSDISRGIVSKSGIFSASGDNIILPNARSNLRKGIRLVFEATVTSGTDFEMGFSVSESSATTNAHNIITVDNTNVTYNNTSYPHNLNITDRLQMIFEYLSDGTADITLLCNGNSFKQNVGFTMSNVAVPYVKSNGLIATDCKLTFICTDIRKKIWCFGDSYFAYSTKRWTYYLKEYGYDTNVLLDGFAGMGSVNGRVSFAKLLNLGTPKIAVWFLGMNDGTDTNDTTPNANWVTEIDNFISLCETNGIEPIFATIPNVPSINHNGKNAWIKSSGYRYIDMCHAVGADANVNWYGNMLSSDNVHPSESGAKALFAQVLLDLPEVMLDNL